MLLNRQIADATAQMSNMLGQWLAWLAATELLAGPWCVQVHAQHEYGSSLLQAYGDTGEGLNSGSYGGGSYGGSGMLQGVCSTQCMQGMHCDALRSLAVHQQGRTRTALSAIGRSLLRCPRGGDRHKHGVQ